MTWTSGEGDKCSSYEVVIIKKFEFSIKETSLFSRENIFLGKLFWYQVHFDMHVRTHTREHLYYCSQCHYSSITKNCLKRHVIQKHSNILLKCPTDGCDYSTPDKYKLQAHLKGHTELVSRSLDDSPCPLGAHGFLTFTQTAVSLLPLTQLCARPAPKSGGAPEPDFSPQGSFCREGLRYVEEKRLD